MMKFCPLFFNTLAFVFVTACGTTQPSVQQNKPTTNVPPSPDINLPVVKNQPSPLPSLQERLAQNRMALLDDSLSEEEKADVWNHIFFPPTKLFDETFDDLRRLIALHPYLRAYMSRSKNFQSDLVKFLRILWQQHESSQKEMDKLQKQLASLRNQVASLQAKIPKPIRKK